MGLSVPVGTSCPLRPATVTRPGRVGGLPLFVASLLPSDSVLQIAKEPSHVAELHANDSCLDNSILVAVTPIENAAEPQPRRGQRIVDPTTHTTYEIAINRR